MACYRESILGDSFLRFRYPHEDVLQLRRRRVFVPKHIWHGAAQPEQQPFDVTELQRGRAPIAQSAGHSHPGLVVPDQEVVRGWPAVMLSACSELEAPSSERRTMQPDQPALHLLTTFPVDQRDVVGLQRFTSLPTTRAIVSQMPSVLSRPIASMA
jgi:hypothetical protein